MTSFQAPHGLEGPRTRTGQCAILKWRDGRCPSPAGSRRRRQDYSSQRPARRADTEWFLRPRPVLFGASPCLSSPLTSPFPGTSFFPTAPAVSTCRPTRRSSAAFQAHPRRVPEASAVGAATH